MDIWRDLALFIANNPNPAFPDAIIALAAKNDAAVLHYVPQKLGYISSI